MERHDNQMKLSVPAKIAKVAKLAGLENSNPVQTPMTPDAPRSLTSDESPEDSTFPYSSIIGQLLWIAVYVRTDITFAVNFLSRFMMKPRIVHVQAVKRVILYLPFELVQSKCQVERPPNSHDLRLMASMQ